MNQSIVITEPGKVEIRNSKMPEVKPGEALLKMVYGGICGSDLNSYRGTSPYVSYPRVPGHEFSAEIIEIEKNTLGLKKGMMVTANPYFNCNNCYSCERGLVNCCTTNQTMGVQREGAFSTYFVMPINRLFWNDHIDAKTLALIEPFCIGYHGVKRANPKKGENVLVIGAGTIGLMAAMAAKMLGASVCICDISKKKVDIALELGMDYGFVNKGQSDFMDHVKKMTNGNGFDVTIEAAGLPSTFQNCVDAAAFGARVVVIGVSKETLDFNFTIIQKKELNIMGSRNAITQDFEEAMEYISENKFNLLRIVTNEYKAENCKEAFSDFEKNAASMLKVMINFGR